MRKTKYKLFMAWDYEKEELRWVYFRKKAANGAFDMFSDADSRIRHLNRILILIGAAMVMILPNAFTQVALWSENRQPANLVIAGLFLALSLLILFGFIRTAQKKKAPEKAADFPRLDNNGEKTTGAPRKLSDK